MSKFVNKAGLQDNELKTMLSRCKWTDATAISYWAITEECKKTAHGVNIFKPAPLDSGRKLVKICTIKHRLSDDRVHLNKEPSRSIIHYTLVDRVSQLIEQQ